MRKGGGTLLWRFPNGWGKEGEGRSDSKGGEYKELSAAPWSDFQELPGREAMEREAMEHEKTRKSNAEVGFLQIVNRKVDARQRSSTEGWTECFL